MEEHKRDEACMYLHTSFDTYSDRHILGFLTCAGGIALCCAVLCCARGSTTYILTRTSTYLDVAHYGGHARCMLSSLSPSQPVITDEEFFFREPSPRSLLSSLATFSPLFLPLVFFVFFASFVHLRVLLCVFILAFTKTRLGPVLTRMIIFLELENIFFNQLN